jgi:hypothetical protein
MGFDLFFDIFFVLLVLYVLSVFPMNANGLQAGERPTFSNNYFSEDKNFFLQTNVSPK